MFELAALLMGKKKAFPVGTFQIINAKSSYEIINQLVNEPPEVIKELGFSKDGIVEKSLVT